MECRSSLILTTHTTRQIHTCTLVCRRTRVLHRALVPILTHLTVCHSLTCKASMAALLTHRWHERLRKALVISQSARRPRSLSHRRLLYRATHQDPSNRAVLRLALPIFRYRLALKAGESSSRMLTARLWTSATSTIRPHRRLHVWRRPKLPL